MRANWNGRRVRSQRNGPHPSRSRHRIGRTIPAEAMNPTRRASPPPQRGHRLERTTISPTMKGCSGPQMTEHRKRIFPGRSAGTVTRTSRLGRSIASTPVPSTAMPWVTSSDRTLKVTRSPASTMIRGGEKANCRTVTGTSTFRPPRPPPRPAGRTATAAPTRTRPAARAATNRRTLTTQPNTFGNRLKGGGPCGARRDCLCTPAPPHAGQRLASDRLMAGQHAAPAARHRDVTSRTRAPAAPETDGTGQLDPFTTTLGLQGR